MWHTHERTTARTHTHSYVRYFIFVALPFHFYDGMDWTIFNYMYIVDFLSFINSLHAITHCTPLKINKWRPAILFLYFFEIKGSNENGEKHRVVVSVSDAVEEIYEIYSSATCWIYVCQSGNVRSPLLYYTCIETNRNDQLVYDVTCAMCAYKYSGLFVPIQVSALSAQGRNRWILVFALNFFLKFDPLIWPNKYSFFLSLRQTYTLFFVYILHFNSLPLTAASFYIS